MAIDHPHGGGDDNFLKKEIEKAAEKLKNAKEEIAKEVIGQDKIIEDTLTCMVASGHMLAIGAPGLAKTLLVSRVSYVMGLQSSRTQFTPDLQPADIIGTEVLAKNEQGEDAFKFEKGPLFTQFFMADEINRASPKTQSALLEAMQEKQVTVAGQRYPLSHPFHVMATQNPLEQEGTYPLPEAQLDRFLMKLDFDYPSREAEIHIAKLTTGTGLDLQELFKKAAAGEDLTNPEIFIDTDNRSKLQPALNETDLILMQKLALKMPVNDDVYAAAVDIVRRARPKTSDAIKEANEYVSWGPGPRAVQAFVKAAKAKALMDGRLSPNTNDILELVDPILDHRMALNAHSRSAEFTFNDLKAKLIHGIK
jgi:MoxR-like ATPase